MRNRIETVVEGDFRKIGTMLRRWEKLYEETRNDEVWKVIDILFDLQRQMSHAEEDVG